MQDAVRSRRTTRGRPSRVAALLMTVLTALCSVVVLGFVTAPAANAYQLLGCKWNHKAIHYYVASPYLSYISWSNAASSWAGVDATLTNTNRSIDYYALNENRGNTVTWTGITRKHGTVSTAPPCNSNNYWVKGEMDVVINWSLVESLDYGPPKKKMVAAHEMGHAFGLAHTPKNKNLLMYPYDDERKTKVPVADDKAGVNALY